MYVPYVRMYLRKTRGYSCGSLLESMMQFAASPNAVFSRLKHGAIRVVLSITGAAAFAEHFRYFGEHTYSKIST